MFLSTVFTRTSLKPCFLSPFTLLLACLLSVSRLSSLSLVSLSRLSLPVRLRTCGNPKSSGFWGSLVAIECLFAAQNCAGDICVILWTGFCFVLSLTGIVTLERERERARELGFDGTAGDLEESGSRPGRSRVWSRMVVLVWRGCVQCDHCPVPALSPWLVSFFACLSCMCPFQDGWILYRIAEFLCPQDVKITDSFYVNCWILCALKMWKSQAPFMWIAEFLLP